MNKKNKNRHTKWDREVVVCFGTDIPPLSTIELLMWTKIRELISEKNTNILEMNDIFEEYTHTKIERFELLSRLVKKKIIKRKRIGNTSHEYTLIPKNTFKDSEAVRIYKPKTRKDRIVFIKSLIA